MPARVLFLEIDKQSILNREPANETRREIKNKDINWIYESISIYLTWIWNKKSSYSTVWPPVNRRESDAYVCVNTSYLPTHCCAFGREKNEIWNYYPENGKSSSKSGFGVYCYVFFVRFFFHFLPAVARLAAWIWCGCYIAVGRILQWFDHKRHESATSDNSQTHAHIHSPTTRHIKERKRKRTKRKHCSNNKAHVSG